MLKKREVLDNLIRVFVCEIVKLDEFQHLIDNDIFKEVDYVYKM